MNRLEGEQKQKLVNNFVFFFFFGLVILGEENKNELVWRQRSQNHMLVIKQRQIMWQI